MWRRQHSHRPAGRCSGPRATVRRGHGLSRWGWLEVTATGVVWAGGGANYFGDLKRRPGAHPVTVSNIVQVRPTLDGFGYWLVGSDGSVYSFGDARYFGSLPGLGVQTTGVVGLVPFSSDARLRDWWVAWSRFGNSVTASPEAFPTVQHFG